MGSPVLSVDEVQTYIRDQAENNRLIDGQEFNPTVITLAMELAISTWNLVPPASSHSVDNFPYKSLLMSGTLWKMYAGQAALLARNTMNYSDGGIQIPIEERFALYQSLAAMYQEDFLSMAQKLKTAINMEEGWGEVMSDEARFPLW